MVADVPRVLRIRVREELLDLGPGRPCRERLLLEEPRAFNRRSHAGCTPLPVFGIAEEGPQRLGGGSDRYPTPAVPAGQEERIDVTHRDSHEGALMCAPPLAKLSHKPRVGVEGFAGQAPFMAQIRGKALDEAGKRRDLC